MFQHILLLQVLRVSKPSHRRLRYQTHNGRLSNPDTVWPDRHTKSSLAEGRSEHASAIESVIVLWRWRRPSRALSQLWTHRPPLWAHIMQQTKACHSLACPKDWFRREFNRFKMRCNKHHNDGVKMHLWHDKSRLFSHRQTFTCYAYKSYSVNTACLSFSIIFTFMHLADTFIQSDLQCFQDIHLYFHCVCSLGIEPTTFALLPQCSNWNWLL